MTAASPIERAPVGFIGLGRMGGPMARHLAQAGFPLHVFDVDPAAAARAAALPGATRHDAPDTVARAATVLFTTLPTDAIVTETYLGARGVLTGARPGLVSADCSTVSPEVSQKIHAAGVPRGVHHLDTPMLGSSPQAESGEVFFMVGGEERHLAAVRPMLDVMGRLTMFVGPPGTGNRIKLLHNALGAVNAVAVAESLALCTRLGVDPETYFEVVTKGGGMAYSTYFDRRVRRLVAGDFTPTFTLELMHKDVTLASQMAGQDLAALPILRETLATFAEGKARGWGHEDFSGVTHVVEERLGLRVSRTEPAR